MMVRFILALAAVLSLTQRQGAPPQPGAPGPWDNDVQVYREDRIGRVEWLATFPRAGVATIARMPDGRLIAAHQYFPESDPASFDRVAMRFSSDEGKTWTDPMTMKLAGLPDGMRFPFDPTLVVLPDKRVRMYYTSTPQRTEGVPAIYSAISENGIDFTVEPGRRFGVDGRAVIDCAVVLHRGTFHLYAPLGEERGKGYHATSADGLAFTRRDDVKMDGDRRWLGGAVSNGDEVTFFGTGDPDPQGPRLPSAVGAQPPAGAPRPVTPAARRGGTLWTGTSRDGESFRPASAPTIPGADPGAVAARDGGWIVVVTGPPRNGTASANRPGNVGRVAGPPAAAPIGDGGPRNHRLMMATSKDGMNWQLIPNAFAERASTPALFVGPDGRLIAIYVESSDEPSGPAIAARVEMADGTWQGRATDLRGVDPDVVRQSDGGFRAYTRAPDGSIAMSLSRDGLTWTFVGTAFRDPQFPNATDPDVFETPTGWIMLLTDGPQLLRATSTDGLSFITSGAAMLGGTASSTVKTGTGWRTYLHGNSATQTGGQMAIRSATSASGASWRVDPGDRLAAPPGSLAQNGVSRPALAQRADGTWVMLVTAFIQQPAR